jgi:hypothetical protein
MSENGFDDLAKRLKQLEKNAVDASGTHEVPFSELFSAGFMAKHTHSGSIDEFLGDLGVSNRQDFADLPQEALEAKVKAETDYDSWEDMQTDAATAWTAKRLGF